MVASIVAALEDAVVVGELSASKPSDLTDYVLEPAAQPVTL